MSVEDHTIGGDLLAGANHKNIALVKVTDGYAGFSIAAQHRRLFSTHGEQRGEGLGGAALCLELKPAPKQQERNDHPHGFEVNVVHLRVIGTQRHMHGHAGHARVAEEERVERPAKGGGGAQRDERVHRGGAMLQVGPRGAVEGRAADDVDERCEYQAGPLPVLELEGRDHGEEHHGQRERRRDERALQDVGSLTLAGGVRRAYRRLPLIVHRKSPVAGAFDDVDEIGGGRRRWVIAYGGRFRGEVDRGFDVVELVELAFNPG